VGSKSKTYTVGYRYKMGLHFGLCRGPVDSVQELIVGERPAWVGPVTDTEQVYINSPELFGGDKREGGVLGYCDMQFGRDDQDQNSYLLTKIGSLIPAFRGIVSVVFRGGRVTSNNPYIKPWWWRVERINTTGDGSSPQWYDAKAAIDIEDQGERILFQTHYIEINALSNAATSVSGMKSVAAYDIDGLETTDEIELSPNYEGLYIAWAPWGTPALAGANTGSSYTFRVVYDNDSTADTFGANAGPYDGYEAARQAFVTDSSPVTLTGHGRYRFGIIDSLVSDNTGGISLIAKVYRRLSFRSMNPAHIIRECYTDPYMRMNYPTSMIDDTSFTESADAFYSEGMGLCLFWSRQTPIEEFIQTVLDHCSACCYADPETGKFVLKAIRNDYDPDTLDEYDESSIKSIEKFQRTGPGEIINEITVVYTDIVTGRDASITVSDNAAIQAQGAIISQTKRYPGIPTAALAARVAQRDLTAVSQSLAQLKVHFTRKAWPIRPGGVIKVSWAKLGISSMICRVLSVDYGLIEDGTIVADLAEDVFGLPSSSFQADQPTGWEEPSTEPVPVEIQDVLEAPYYHVAANMSAADLAYVDPDAGYVLTLAGSSDSLQLGYNIYSRISPAAYEQRDETGPMAPTAVLYDTIDRNDTTLHLTDLADFDGNSVEVGDLLMVGTGADAEFMQVSDVTYIDSGIIEVSRGILDTTPGPHLTGERVWLFEDTAGLEGIERATADVINLKLTAFTGTGESLLGSAVPMSITMNQRFYRPYAPGKIRIDGEEFPTADVSPGFLVEWAHRDRTQQTASYITQDDASIGPEASTTYSLYFYDDASEALKHSITGVSGTSYTMPSVAGAFAARLEIAAVRDGVESWQRQIREFNYVGTFPMLGAMLTDSSSTSLTQGSDTTINWDTEVADWGGFFDAGAPTVLTAPESGYYVASFNHVMDLGSASWYSASRITCSSTAASGLTTLGYSERSVLTSVDLPRSSIYLDRLDLGDTLIAVTNWYSGSGSRTMEAGAKFNIARVYSVPAMGGVARRSSSQSISTATDTAVQFVTEYLDDGGLIDLATQNARFTVPTDGAGWYIIAGFVRWPSTASVIGRRTIIGKNGATPYIGVRSFVSGPVTGTNGGAVATIEYLNDADYIQLIARQTSGSSISLSEATMSVARVSTPDTVGGAMRYDGSAQTVNSGSDVLITFDTVLREDGYLIDLGSSSSKIYAPVDGLYAIAGQVGFAANTGSDRYAKLVVDGTTEIAREGTDAPSAGNAPCCNPFAVHYLQAGQYVELYARTGTNTSTDTGNYRPRLAMVLLCTEAASS